MSNINHRMGERVYAVDQTSVSVAIPSSLHEDMQAPYFIYDFECVGPSENHRDGYINALIELQEAITARKGTDELLSRQRALDSFSLETKWIDGFRNTVCTGGKNDLLDKYFAGSSYTAAWYLSLISSSGYSAINAADTMASHAGWTESSAYSNSTRVAPSFSSASSGSKATSSAAAFNINSTDTIKGGFVTTVSTKAGTTGILYSAGLFSGGDRSVTSGDTLNCSLTLSV